MYSPTDSRPRNGFLGGPVCPLPDLRVHELFEDRAIRHPAAVAARFQDQQWTYGRLNHRASLVADALIDAGNGRDDIVAVITPRNLDWLAAVLGIFKAGCAYLPVEPTLPPARVAAMLDRSNCRTVLSGLAGASGGLQDSLRDRPGLTVLPTAVPDGPDENAGRRSGIHVDAGQLAYVFFTSGSTGEPKGAMCEHAGMLNHMLAKVEDLGLGPGDIVAQTAPVGFDISLWQLLAALLVGGQVLIIEPGEIRDVQRFAGTLAARQVTVAQLVPSYLDLLVSFLERHPAPLPGLRRMLATGEALRPELANRWFGVCPEVPLVNAYGLTETCDDTNHHVMTGPVAHARVPLGPPVRNVRISVVDECLRPVPPGSPGEIIFSGVCVGRGYINDPERTSQAFLPDPDIPGGRRYRSGDLGRWLPDGSLDFLGRRDTQVKVHGIRVELGEVESELARVPGVRDAVAVAVADQGSGFRLAAFFTGSVPAGQARAALAEVLPEHLVPGALHHLDAFPLTANGKVDRKALAARVQAPPGTAAVPPSASPAGPPRTHAEHQVAAAWAEVLGVDPERITRADHFFRLGGSSLSAIRLALRLEQAVSMSDVVEHPVLADLAALLDSAA